MEKTDSQKIGTLLKKRYTLALSLIAFLVICSQVMIETTLVSQENDSRVVNIAGRQRMLSQRISKSVLGLVMSEDSSARTHYYEELADSLPIFLQSQQGLQKGDPELGLPGKNSPQIAGMFATLDPSFRALSGAAGHVLELTSSPGYSQESLLPDLHTVQVHDDLFLKGMDDIVFRYDMESRTKVHLIRNTEIVIFFVTFLILSFEALFIFRPARKKIEETVAVIEEGKANLELLFETAPSAMFLLDQGNLQINKLNHLAREILDLKEKTAETVNLYAMLEQREADGPDVKRNLLSGEPVDNAEMVLNLKEGTNLVVLLSSNIISYENRKTILLGLSDITRLKEAEEVLKRYATIDEMTGFLNKRSGMLVLENAFVRAQKNCEELCLCFCDIDGLKAVNDTWGHEEGDFYIKTISRIIRNNISASDTGFRFGGDEIVLVLTNCTSAQAAIVMHRIEENLAFEAGKSGKPYLMHFSFGIASSFGPGGENFEELLAVADQEMYRRKKLYKETLRQESNRER